MDALQGTGARGVLGVPDFRRILLVGLLVSIARWLEMLVIGVVVWQQTQSAFLVAMMTLLRLLPMGLFGAFLGVAADRVQRRSALLAMLGVQGVVALGLSALALGGALAVWHLAVASFIAGIVWAADNPVRRMMLGEVVGANRMARAVSLDVVCNNASRIAGPALGGTLLAAAGLGPAFLLCGGLYALAVLAALRLTHRSTVLPRQASVLRDMRESFGLVLRTPGMAGVMIVTLIFNLFAWPVSSMIPVIGQEQLRLGADGVGLLAGMDGLGALLGAALLVPLVRPAWYRAIYVGGTAMYCGMFAVFAAITSAVPAALALLLVGVGSAAFAAMQATLVYTTAPPEMRSRALGVLSACIGLGLIGFLHLGAMAHWLGAPLATMVIGIEGLCALALTRRWWRRPPED
ncbi:MFS transporter [Falsiroseomonas tokyonensis]|uniref:MFS transporter n=1 Tax=Falsiroseomonas tokyonensis TaxID=430521 RepID=A0ABV7BQY8_9PROT|nr:MFS transporter [Falsiroseomonas tokyonensis]MBU8538061.1 MFS transporter [Falsiroseomonas tokyonensis]